MNRTALINVAEYILVYNYTKHKAITNLRLQYLLYFSWIDYYKSTHQILFTDEFYVGKSGPISPYAYRLFCTYGGKKIERIFFPELENKQDYSLLADILDKYAAINTKTLIRLATKKGSPWDIVYENGRGLNCIIPFRTIITKECTNV